MSLTRYRIKGQTTLDQFMEQKMIEIRIDTYDACSKTDKMSNWVCLHCGSTGREKKRYKSSLWERAHAHYVCRCKKIKAKR